RRSGAGLRRAGLEPRGHLAGCIPARRLAAHHPLQHLYQRAARAPAPRHCRRRRRARRRSGADRAERRRRSGARSRPGDGDLVARSSPDPGARRRRGHELPRGGGASRSAGRHRHVAPGARARAAARGPRRRCRPGPEASAMSDRELPPESPISGDTISETELHAWIDGELPAERCSAVTVYLASHPEIAARMRRHRQQMQLMRRAFEPLLDRPQPRGVLALLAAGSRGVLWRRRAVTGLAAACLAAFLLVAGWLAHRAMPGDNYVAEAVTAYRLAVIDRAANGVWAITPEGLPGTLERLSRRVGVPLKVPALADQGFTITSGRLVPASSGATAAQ